MSSLSTAATLPRHAVLADALPQVRVRDATLVLAGALLTALLAQVQIDVPPSPVPITGQTLAVGLVGATLGARRGALALALYALLGLFLPFYAGGSSGWHVVWGASGGYIVGFVFAFGLAGLKIAVGESWSWTIHNGFTIFIVGGLFKAAIGALVLPSAWGLVRRFEHRP